jgi:hypothetical protein
MLRSLKALCDLVGISLLFLNFHPCVSVGMLGWQGQVEIAAGHPHWGQESSTPGINADQRSKESHRARPKTTRPQPCPWQPSQTYALAKERSPRGACAIPSISLAFFLYGSQAKCLLYSLLQVCSCQIDYIKRPQKGLGRHAGSK